MTQVQDAIGDLERFAAELEKLSNSLADVELRLEPAQAEYDSFMEDFTAGLWDRYEAGEVKRWPGEDTRVKLARRAMESDVKVRYDTLNAARKRMIRHLAALTAAIGAQRSILSAEKTIVEASG